MRTLTRMPLTAVHYLSSWKARSERGQLIVMAAFLLPVLIGFAGLAIDVGIIMKNRTERQRTADSAAISAAQYLMFDRDEDGAKQIACDFAQHNGYGKEGCSYDYTLDDCPKEVCVNLPPLTGPHIGDHLYVEVVVRRSDPTLFIQVLGVKTKNVTARAVGGATPLKRNYALIVLDPTQCDALSTSSSIAITGGGVMVDSDGTTGGSCIGESAVQGGGSVVTAKTCYGADGNSIDCALDYNSSGKWTVCNNCTASPPPTKAPLFPDPLSCPDGTQAHLAYNGHTEDYCPRPVPCKTLVPETTSCVPISPTACGNAAVPCSTNKLATASSPNSTHLAGAGDVTLYPGVYYGGLDINSTSQTVHFRPGIYILAGTQKNGNGGGLNYQSGNMCGPLGASDPPGSCPVAKDVTFFNTSNGSLPCNSYKLTGSGKFKFNGPDEGHAESAGSGDTLRPSSSLTGYLNMLIWQDDACTAEFTFAGSGNGGDWTETGMMYLPDANMKVTGGGNFGSIQIITKTFKQSGSQAIVINFTRYVDTDTNYYKLVE